MTDFETEVLRLLKSIDDRLKVIEEEADWVRVAREVETDNLKREVEKYRRPLPR